MVSRTNTFLLYAFLALHFLFLPEEVISRRLGEVQDEDFMSRRNLRIVTFGTSMTWGSGLEEAERQGHAYPWLLSKNVTNLAIRASGPAYPSVCTESMVGDRKIYDVIILEYYMRASQGLVALAQRLRQRFPDATIIVLRMWNPMHIGLKGGGKNVKDWYTEKHPNGAINDSQLRSEMLKMPSNSFDFKHYDTQEKVQEEAIRAVGGHLVELYHPEDAIITMARYARWFSPDWHHLSKEGHQAVAHSIINKLKQIQPRRSDSLGTWGAGDACHNFYSTGNCTVSHSSELTLTMFNERSQKYALELRSSSGGTITVHNPFDGPREVYLAFMATGPSPSIYPKVRVSSPGHPDFAPVVLDPTSYVDDGHPVHVSKVGFAGMVPPGDTIVRLQPLEETGVPFRLTGLSITGALDLKAFAFDLSPAN